MAKKTTFTISSSLSNLLWETGDQYSEDPEKN